MAKKGLTPADTTLNAGGMCPGVQSKSTHTGMDNPPILRQWPGGHFENHIKPLIPLGRLIEPGEIAEAVCVLIENPASSGQLWVDGGLAPMA